MKRSDEDFRLTVASAVGDGRDILEALRPRRWTRDVEHRLPRGPEVRRHE